MPSRKKDNTGKENKKVEKGTKATPAQPPAPADRMRARLEFLDSAGEILAESLDFKTTLSNVARLAVPRIADWCAVDLCGGDYCDDNSGIQRLIVTHVDPEKIQLAYDLEKKYPPDPNAPGGVHNVIRSGEAL